MYRAIYADPSRAFSPLLFPLYFWVDIGGVVASPPPRRWSNQSDASDADVGAGQLEPKGGGGATDANPDPDPDPDDAAMSQDPEEDGRCTVDGPEEVN